MLRIGPTLCPWVLSLAVAAGCSDDGGSTATTSTTAGPSTTAVAVDETPAPGEGVLVLDGEPITLTVTACVRDEVVGGITTVIRLDAIDGDGGALLASRQRTEGSTLAPTVTDVVNYTTGSTVLEAQRFQVDALWADLRAPEVREPLLAVVDDVVRAAGSFGHPGSVVGDASLVEGVLNARCPVAP